MRIFLVDPGRWLRMVVTIMLRRQAENESDQNKNDDAFFFGSENESLPERVES
jgi:tRNA(Leu) C34 or U34 (ribose-2'-O)-methylase TrmL